MTWDKDTDQDKDLIDKTSGGEPEEVVIEDAGDQDDERLVRGEEHDDGQGGTDEERRQRNREARRKKKERQRALYEENNRLNAVNQGLQDALAQLNARLARIENGSVEDQASRIERSITNADNALQAAKERLRKALADQDVDTVVAANEQIASITVDKSKLEEFKQRFADARRAANKDRDTQGDDADQTSGRRDTRVSLPPVVLQNFEVFKRHHPWYDVTGGDEDSRILKAIDEGVTRDGFDPRTRDYWDELEDRIAQRLPHRAYKTPDADPKNPDKRGAPANLTGGSGRTGNNKDSQSFKLSAARVQALKEAGVWDDPKARAKHIEAYKRFDQQSAQGA